MSVTTVLATIHATRRSAAHRPGACTLAELLVGGVPLVAATTLCNCNLVPAKLGALRATLVCKLLVVHVLLVAAT